jgi:hypothetical protein
VLTGGNLNEQLIDAIMLGPKNRIVSADGAKLVMSFSSGNGSFTGRVFDPLTSRTASFHGVVLQKQNLGSGYFLGTTESGEVALAPD